MESSICLLDKQNYVEEGATGVFPIYSITKTLIASALFKLRVPVEDSVHNWVSSDWCPHTLTLAQLLNHSSGLRDYGMLPEYHNAIEEGSVWTDQEFADHTLKQPLLFEPGTQFSYSNPGYWLLKCVVERETGTSLASALKALIFKPLDMDSAYVAAGIFADDLPDYPAEWVWHGLVMANAQDVAKFLSLIDQSQLLQNQISVADAPSPWKHPHYGNGLMIEPGKWFGHNGGGPGYSASAFHFQETGVTGCMLSKVAQESVKKPTPDLAMKILFDRVLY